jgi:hypothetical protein
MPFDELKRRALEALDGRRQAYHSAVATAADEVRALLDTQRSPRNGKHQRVAGELGMFAAGRIDPERFASVFSEQETLEPEAVDKIEAALATLTGLLAEGDDLYTAKVPSGGDLHDVVRAALARAGKAFGAGRAVENARSGVRASEYADGFAPRRWNRAERGIAPPLVVELEGSDLRPAALVDLLEGRQVIVLLVRRPAPPAALARLIAPGTLVVQGTGDAALATLNDWDGPAVVAIIPEGVASYSYRPAEDGPGTLKIDALPEGSLKPIGMMSAARQESDLALLRMLDGAVAGRVVAAAAGNGAAAAAAEPADKLASWLLRQATIPSPGED